MFNCGHEYAKATSKPRVNRRDDQGAEHGHSYDHAHHTHDGAAAVLTLLSAVLIVTHETNSVLTAYDLLGHAADNVPTMMNYTTLLAKDSMYNTPPCWCIYMTGLVLKYLENDIGGLANMQKINEAKAKVTFPLQNSWYINGFYDGLSLFGETST